MHGLGSMVGIKEPQTGLIYYQFSYISEVGSADEVLQVHVISTGFDEFLE